MFLFTLECRKYGSPFPAVRENEMKTRLDEKKKTSSHNFYTLSHNFCFLSFTYDLQWGFFSIQQG